MVANLSRFSQHAELSLPVPARAAPRRDVGRSAFPPDRRRPLLRLPRTARLLLVRAREEAAEPTRRRGTRLRPEAWPEVIWTEAWQERFAEDLGPNLAPVLPAAAPVALVVLGQVARADPRRGRRRRPRHRPLRPRPRAGRLRRRRARAVPACPLAAALGRARRGAGRARPGRGPGPAARTTRALPPASSTTPSATARSASRCSTSWAGAPGSRICIGELEGWSDRQIRQTRALQADRVPGQVTVAAGDASVTFGSRFILRLVRRPEEEHPDLEVVALPGRARLHALSARARRRRLPDAGRDLHPRRPAGLRPARDGRVAGHPRRAGTLLRSGSSRARPPRRGPRRRTAELAARDLPEDVTSGHRALPGRRSSSSPSARRRCTSRWPPIRSTRASPPSRFRRCTSARSSSPCATWDAPSSIACAAGCARCPKSVQPDAQRVGRAGGGDPQALARRLRDAPPLEAHPLPRQLPPRPRPLHGPRLRGAVLRGRARAGSLAERRIKRSPLRDVASMLRSFHYVTAHALSGRVSSGAVRAEDMPVLEPALRAWRAWVGAAFLRKYLQTAAGAPFAPACPEELQARRSPAICSSGRCTRSGTSSSSGRSGCTIPLSELLDLMKA